MSSKASAAKTSPKPKRHDVLAAGEKRNRVGITLKIWTLRGEVSALNDKFLLHLFDMLAMELLRPFGKAERQKIFTILKDYEQESTSQNEREDRTPEHG